VLNANAGMATEGHPYKRYSEATVAGIQRFKTTAFRPVNTLAEREPPV